MISLRPSRWPRRTTAASIQTVRDRVYDAVIGQARAEHELRAAQETLTAAQQQAAAVRAQLTTAQRAASDWQVERERRVQLRTEHHQFRPGFLEWLTSLGKAMREWRQRDQAAAAQVETGLVTDR